MTTPATTTNTTGLPSFSTPPSPSVSTPSPREGFSKELLFASKAEHPSISQVPEIPELELLRRVDAVMGHHKYVTVELLLDDGAVQKVHFVRPKDFPGAVAIHVAVHDKIAAGPRFSSLALRAFLGLPEDAVPTQLTSGYLAHEIDGVLSRVEDFLDKRSKKPLVVNVSTQGYHEPGPLLIMGRLTDTGGQDGYCYQTAQAYSRMGFQVVNVNRGGPNHPIHGFVRVGMHYHADGCDLLFLDDGDEGFVVKEDMYETPGLEQFDDLTMAGSRKKEGRCPKLAEDLLRQLEKEQVVLMIGHYADGGETTRIAAEIIKGQNGERPPVWHVPHSTGYLKRDTLQKAGLPVEERFHIEDRARTEARVYAHADRVLSTSPEISHSLTHHYHLPAHEILPIGVDTSLFHPRPAGVSRTDPRYNRIWGELSRLSGRSVEDLQGAEMVLEYSRTVSTKGKLDVINGFAKSLELDPGRNRILVMNIADPQESGLSEVDNQYARELRQRIVELGLQGKVIFKGNFDAREECPLLCQITDVAISGAKMETWGMAVHEQASSGCPIFCTTIVPIGTNVLQGSEPYEVAFPGGSTVSWGTGVVRFNPGDINAIAHLISYAFSAEGREPIRQLGERAYHQVIPEYAWDGILQKALEKFGGFTFVDGRVVWPQE
ncbi:MAG: glycosyltransferase [Bdellovibrionota bacterium]|nr:MAG: glycosyltransferase [Bdellovibrionota bacterium]